MKNIKCNRMFLKRGNKNLVDKDNNASFEKKYKNMFFFKTMISFFKDEEYRELMLATIVVLGMGTVVYHYLEGWNWLDSLYFSVITLTTIGYGDFSPQTDAGKVFTIFYILIGLGMILGFINTVYHHYNSERTIKKKEKDSN